MSIFILFKIVFIKIIPIWDVFLRNKSVIFTQNLETGKLYYSTKKNIVNYILENLQSIYRFFFRSVICFAYLLPHFESIGHYEAIMRQSNTRGPVCLAAWNNLQSVPSRVFCHAGLSRSLIHPPVEGIYRQIINFVA